MSDEHTELAITNPAGTVYKFRLVGDVIERRDYYREHWTPVPETDYPNPSLDGIGAALRAYRDSYEEDREYFNRPRPAVAVDEGERERAHAGRRDDARTEAQLRADYDRAVRGVANRVPGASERRETLYAEIQRRGLTRQV